MVMQWSKIMKIKSDSQLILDYQKGDETALELLIKRHQTDLFKFIYYKVLDEELANDIFQETFVKIIVVLKEKRYSDEGKFLVWAKRIAHNLVIDYYRSKSKNINVSETTFESEEFSIFDFISEPSETIEERLVSQQINSDLHRMIVQLPEIQQEVIKLRYFDGLSFKEIADHTDTSINTTLGRVRYALINLRKIMEDHNIILTR